MGRTLRVTPVFGVLAGVQKEKGWDRRIGMSTGLEEKSTGSYLPKEEVARIRASRGSKL